MSQIETDQILNSIALPKEWEDEGKHYRQLVKSQPKELFENETKLYSQACQFYFRFLKFPLPVLTF